MTNVVVHNFVGLTQRNWAKFIFMNKGVSLYRVRTKAITFLYQGHLRSTSGIP